MTAAIVHEPLELPLTRCPLCRRYVGRGRVDRREPYITRWMCRRCDVTWAHSSFMVYDEHGLLE